VIDTPEKFEEHRLYLAGRVWTAMKSTDSRECRNCHSFEFMDFTIQENRASESHQKALDEGMTCIDCHQGIAHDLPEGYLDRYEQVVDQLAAAGKLPGAPEMTLVEAARSEIEAYLATAEN